MTSPPGTGALEATQQQVLTQLQSGGTSGTQYTDGAAAPAHPIGNEIVYNNAGTMTAVSPANPLPVGATVTPAANQRVNAQANDFLAGSIVDLLTLLNLAGTAGDANTVNSLMGRLTKIRDLLNATLNVSQQATVSNSATLQNAQAGNAAGTPLSVLGMSSAVLTVNMTGFTGTVNFEGQEDGTNFKALNAVLVGTNTITQTAVGATTTSIALYEIPVAGLQQVQARTSGVSAGTVTVTGHAVPLPYNGKVVNANVAAFADTTASGTVTNDNDTVSIVLPGGQATALVQITGNNVGTLLFEASPDAGTTWYAVQATAVGASTVATQATANGAWRVNVAGFTNFRVRLHPTTSGTATIKIILSQGVQDVAIRNATKLGQDVMANSAPVVLASDEIVPIKASFTEVGSLSAGALNADLLPSTDVSGYRFATLQITAMATGGTITFQCSNDNVNFVSLQVGNIASLTGFSASTTGAGIFVIPISFHYLRIRQTAWTSGTTTGLIDYHTMAPALHDIAAMASQNGTWTVQPGNTANTTPWLMNIEGQKATYSASIASLAAVSGDIFTITGSASKTIRITRIQISGAATAATDIDIVILKRSTANSSGTSTSPSAVPHDSSDSPATAIINAYTVAPTPGTLVGNLFTRKITVPSLTSPSIASIPQEAGYELRGERAIVLRGTSQVCAVNLPSSPTGGSFSVDITWTEE